MEERSHKQMLEEERALAEQVDIPPEMRGIWLGQGIKGVMHKQPRVCLVQEH